VEDDVKNDKEKIPPVHPGDILLEDFLKHMGIMRHRPLN
jgi:plasmid maintenance system antidote protein VapI